MDFWIMHVDMDAFFASVEQRDNPALKGMPVAVGGKAEERGVISTASYEARKYGVHSAMPTATALRNCPGLILLPPDHKKYVRASEEMMSILRQYTPLVEPVSLDEAFMDITGSLKLFGSPVEIGRAVQSEIKNRLRLTASVGIGNNKLIAKLASDWQKPEGLTLVEDVDRFLCGLPVSKLWGAGPRTVEKLHKIGVTTVRQLRDLSAQYLTARFGAAGERLYQMARGIDQRPVTAERQAKSVGKEMTFSRDICDRDYLLETLLQMSDQVCRVLRRQSLVCQCITLKIKYPDFKTVTRSHTLGDPTSDGVTVYRAARRLLQQHWNESRPVRLIGVSCTRLCCKDDLPGVLFNDSSLERKKKLNEAVDSLLDRFGEEVLVRGRLVRKGRPGNGENGM